MAGDCLQKTKYCIVTPRIPQPCIELKKILESVAARILFPDGFSLRK